MRFSRSKRIVGEAQSIVTAYFKGPVGLSFFVAWISCAFYSDIVWSGGRGLLDEYPMVISMTASGIVGLTIAIVLGCRASVPRWWRSWVAWAASALCGAGVVLIAGASYVGYDALVAVGAVVMAVGFSALTLAWGSRVSFLDEAMIEFSIPASFVIARVLFFAIGLFGECAALVCVVLLPFLSAALLGRGVGVDEFERFAGPLELKQQVVDPLPSVALRTIPGVWATLLILLLLRAGYGLVRSMASESVGSGVVYYLFRFAVPVFAFGLFIVVSLHAARAIDVRLAVAWCLPLVLLAGALLPLGGVEGFRFASAVNTVASLCLQTFFWIVLAKAGHRRARSGTFFFSCYLAGLCLGIAGGSVLGAGLTAVWDDDTAMVLIQVCLALIAAGVLALERRALGLSASSVTNGWDVDSVAGEGTGLPLENHFSAGALQAAVKSQAYQIAEAYRLTNREREVLEYLLAGYNRPYIRDHLYISLNTVGTHVRSIFVKLDVHSQQELMDFAREQYPR